MKKENLEEVVEAKITGIGEHKVKGQATQHRETFDNVLSCKM